MLAISSTNALSLLDPVLLKRAPSSAPSCLPLTGKPSATVWSSDNAFLFLASAEVIYRYDASTNSLKNLFSTPGTDPITTIVSKDKSTLIYSAGNKIDVLECGSIPKISQTFDSHKSSITSLSLSNDCTLLASTSLGTVHVHNLSLGSHTVLRGPALAGQTIATSEFHPHSRTRLLLGVDKQLIVYDTTRPSAPIKTIALNDTTPGEITAIACSPFSKTLVAVATTGGSVGLVDLDKEKGLFRTINLKVPLTSLTFSAEGAAIYMGTENGKLLMMDLRALDKPPKSIVISDSGSRIEAMSIQKKIKGGVEPNTKPHVATTTLKSTTQPPEANPVRRVSTQAQASKPTSKAAPSPARARIARVGLGASPARRLPPSMKEATMRTSSPLVKRKLEVAPKKKVFSPVRDPLGNSGSVDDISSMSQRSSHNSHRWLINSSPVEIETLNAMKAAAKTTPVKTERISTSRTRLSSSPRIISGRSATTSARSVQTAAADEEQPRRARTMPTAPRTRKTSTTESISTAPTSRLTVPTDVLHQPQEPSSGTRPRSRAASSASRAGSESVSARSGRPGSSASRPGSSMSRMGSSPIPPVPPLPLSRTPSPEFPAIGADPVTPIPAGKRGLEVLGLGTPEVDLWIQAGKGKEKVAKGRKDKGKGKTVGFMTESDSEDDNNSNAEEAERERERSLTMQVSPRRPGTNSSASWAPSPLRHPVSGSPAGVGGSAHDLLRTIVQDVMYDFQRETKAEMTGLHLDLLRMGRGWKHELRGLMDEYVGDLKDLREENRRLREENERLRRGY
ncbi:WD40-repeat-containing domain protein [Collybia nuda]|uniref:WD40-repeat-containing domain protein n=1 Tax=Collybia nuda TaxID=64659 RepID=A0A9P5YKS3_9AGAR|nr:WD40-repeat-containing domain protein [Collybia nuda]